MKFSEKIRPEVSNSFVPLDLNRKTQKNLIQKHLNEAVELNIVGENPINEFGYSHLATLVFQTLFPDGKGDPTNLSMLRDVSNRGLEDFALKLTHLLKFGEKRNEKWYYRFASYPRFAYWAFNMLYRKRILSKGNLCIKHNQNDADFTLAEFNEIMREPSSSRSVNLMSKIFYYSKEITGSNSYWNKIREELKTIIKQVGVPTIFFTLSMAEFHWQDFLSLLKCSGNDVTEIRKLIQDNPHLVDWYFTQRIQASWHWYRFEYASRGSIHCHGVAKLKDDPGLVNLTKLALKGFLAKEIKSKNTSNLSDLEISQLELDINSGNIAEIEVCSYIDKLVSTINPIDSDSWTKPLVHPCKVSFNSFNPARR